MEEKVLWRGNPSQIQNLGLFVLCTLTCWLVIPVFIALWRFIVTKNHKVEITDQRVLETKGVFSRSTDEVELYRIKDIRHDEPFLLRLFKLSNIKLISSDRTDPTVSIPAVKQGKMMKEKIRKAVEQRRDKKGVLEVD